MKVRVPWIWGWVAGLLMAGCEGGAGRSELVSRTVLADGSVRSVYEEPTTTETGAPAIQRTTIIEPPAGTPTTNVIVTPVSGIVNGEPTNTPPGAAMPTLPGLPPGATPLPPAP